MSNAVEEKDFVTHEKVTKHAWLTHLANTGSTAISLAKTQPTKARLFFL